MSVGIWELDVSTIEQNVSSYVERVIQAHPLVCEELVVFGSYGRGCASSDSDLDVLVVVSLSEELSDIERRDLFTGVATRIEEEFSSKVAEIDEIDVLVSTVYNRDKVLRDCLETVDSDLLQEAPCLAYSLTEQKKINILHP